MIGFDKANNMKFLKYIILAFIFAIHASNTHAYDFVVDGIAYNKLTASINEVEVTSYTNKYGTNTYSGNITIPSKVTYSDITYKVIAIGNSAFSGCGHNIKAVTMPVSIIRIGDGSFSSLWDINSIVIPSGVTEIGNEAFNDCQSIESIVIPDNVVSIGDEAFDYCLQLKTVTLGKSVKKIGKSAFSRCGILNSINIPNSVETIGESCFTSCSSLQSIEIPNSVTTIGKNVFHDCKILKSVTLSNNITKIDDDLFCNCEKLESINIPNSVISIGNRSFMGCNNLVSVKNSSNLVSIGKLAFDECYLLTSISFPKTLQSIGDQAFYSCPSLSLVISEMIEPFALQTQFFYVKPGLGIQTQSKTLRIPAGTKQKYIDKGWTGYFSEVIEQPIEYQFTVSSSGYGNVVYDGTSIRNGVKEFVVNGGTSATVTFSPDNGYKIASVKVNDTDVTSSVSNNRYTISNISANTTLSVTFEAIPPTIYTLSITASGNGSASYNSTTVRNQTKSFTVNEGTSATITFTPDNGYRVASVKVNNTDVTSSVSNNNYTISNISTNTTMEVVFGEEINTVTIDNITYNLNHNEKTAEVTSGTNGYSGKVVIPATINSNGTTYSVTSIGNKAFYDCPGLHAITIPNSVTSIGSLAFEGCAGLTSVTIPNSVISIGISAFQGCSSLTSVTIPNSVISIGNYAFTGCSSLTAVHISDLAAWCKISFSDLFSNPLYFAHHLFLNGTEIKDLEVPSSVKSIKNYAFYGYTGLTSVTVANSVTSIGDSAFYGCSGLTSVTIGNSVTSIGDSAFYGCSGLSSLTIGDSVTSIGHSAFYGCSGLTSVTIPNSVTSIGFSAFENCSGLTSVTIPNSVISIGGYAFRGCSGLTAVHISDLEAWCKISFSNLFSNPLYYAHHLFLNGTEIKDLKIPNSMKSIGKYSFISCSGLISVTIPTSITSIDNHAFESCSNMNFVKSEIISPFYISDDVFEGISSNATLQVPKDTKSNYQAINGWAINFKNIIEEEETITYTLSITASGNGSANYNSTTIKNKTQSFTVDEGTSATITFTPDNGYRVASVKVNNTDVTSSVSNNKYTISNIKANTTMEVVFGEEVNTVTIDYITYNLNHNEKTAEVTYRNISSADYTGNVVIPQSITANGTKYTVTSIGANTFYRCSGLTSVTIPNTIISIGRGAFKNCSGLTSISIPNSVTSIGDFAFQGCSGLTSIYIENGNTKYDSRENSNAIIETSTNTLITGCKNTIIPNSVTSIGSWAFSGSSSLTSITIPASVTKIDDHAFYECVSLTSLAMSNSVISIGEFAYYGCSSLISITLPASVTSIGSSAFCNCSNLNFVKSEIMSPFSISTTVYDEISSDATLQVPKGTKSKYQEFSGWTTHFKNIIEEGETTTYTLSITASGNGSATYNSTTIRSKTQSFDVDEGTSATVTFSPDSGYRIASVKLNNTDVTSNISNNKYTISSITANTTLSVTFEAIPPTTYTLSISASGNGSASYNSTTVKNQTKSFTVNEGTSATVTFSPDSGYRIASVKVNNTDVTSSVSNNQYTISNIKANTTLTVTFEAIPVPTYTLNITASGNGSATYNSTTIKNKTQSFTVNEGTSAIVTFSPDSGYRIGSVKVNNADVTSSVSNNKYTISNITANTTIVVAFEEEVTALTVEGVNYSVVSQTEKTVNVVTGNYGQVLTVPATMTQNGKTWTVTGISNDALKDSEELAAVIWNPSAAFTATVSNPNLLLYVKSEEYAPAAIKNVVVNGTANSITLTEAASGNNFYCPQAFTARSISYTHRYSMTTGIGESRGWETLALPFDVQNITHETKGDITPFANRKSGDANKPFWLYELTGSGFTEAASIKAYTPYIISMPNNPQYDSQWLLSGSVTFSASNVTVGKTEDVNTATYRDRTFVPNFVAKGAAEGLYALNVNNDYTTNESGMTEGSKFVLNMRMVHPFEAYMTTASNARQVIDVFEDMTTDIKMLGIWEQCGGDDGAVYDLQGRKVSHMTKGVYVGKKGQKYIIK